VLDVFSAGLEAFLAILAGLDQVVQDRDGFFVDVSHFSVPLLVNKKPARDIASAMPAIDFNKTSLKSIS
jgi:hypothetical protein